MAATGTIEKVSIIVSKGSLEGIYPALIMANGARAQGIEADLFSPSSASTPSPRSSTTTSSRPPSGTPDSTCPPSSEASRAYPI